MWKDPGFPERTGQCDCIFVTWCFLVGYRELGSCYTFFSKAPRRSSVVLSTCVWNSFVASISVCRIFKHGTALPSNRATAVIGVFCHGTQPTARQSVLTDPRGLDRWASNDVTSERCAWQGLGVQALTACPVAHGVCQSRAGQNSKAGQPARGSPRSPISAPRQGAAVVMSVPSLLRQETSDARRCRFFPDRHSCVSDAVQITYFDLLAGAGGVGESVWKCAIDDLRMGQDGWGSGRVRCTWER